ncbi:MAG: histidine phosphatase family protein, partial [Acidimicrobiia bacterium]|nr:histidine phosphatase family protein [Acidimicrobiia bacterium]
MLQLILMRHGKSDWDASYGADHDRPLAERGVRSAELM